MGQRFGFTTSELRRDDEARRARAGHDISPTLIPGEERVVGGDAGGGCAEPVPATSAGTAAGARVRGGKRSAVPRLAATLPSVAEVRREFSAARSSCTARSNHAESCVGYDPV